MDGIFNIAKPTGITSHDVVARVRRLARQRSVGHAGTLDPLASGVLPILLGKATRMAEYLSASGKAYRATIRFGIVTDTYDAEGTEVRRAPVTLSEQTIREALAGFLGQQMQTPPLYSAIKRDGQPIYKLARAGQTLELEPRPIEITALTVIAWRTPDLTLDVECSKGTYIRSLAFDLGERLGPGAHLAGLVRTRSGPFRLEDTITLERLGEALADGTWPDYLYAPDEAVLGWRAAILGTESEARVRHGLGLRFAAAPPHAPLPARVEGSDGVTGDDEQPGLMRAYSADGRFLGVLRWDGQSETWHPHKVLLVEPVDDTAQHHGSGV